MVSLQRTVRAVRGTPTLKTRTYGIGQDGLAGQWRRRDVRITPHRERRKDGVEDRDRGGCRLPAVRLAEAGRTGEPIHSPVSVFKARTDGNALGSQPSLVRVPLQLPGNRSSWPCPAGRSAWAITTCGRLRQAGHSPGCSWVRGLA